jgi:hypothetical protein
MMTLRDQDSVPSIRSLNIQRIRYRLSKKLHEYYSMLGRLRVKLQADPPVLRAPSLHRYHRRCLRTSRPSLRVRRVLTGR